jgi:hypothetical protein
MEETSLGPRSPWRRKAFSEVQVVLDWADLSYNPADDLIFPCVLDTTEILPAAEARYIMYYAPHNDPGGICLAYAAAPEGPWREHPGNPVISNRWSPHYAVDHVSGPHAIFVPEASELFLYYHGDNETTRFATSVDGVNFSYGDVAVSADDLEDADGASYARVFRHTMPSTGSRYVMIFLSYRYAPGSWSKIVSHGLYYAWSQDARTWQVAARPILSHGDPAPGALRCSPYLLTYQGRHFLFYHQDVAVVGPRPSPKTAIYSVEVDADLNPIGSPQLWCQPEVFDPTNPRVSDPYLLMTEGSTYLYAAIGPRLHQKIGLAKVARHAPDGL